MICGSDKHFGLVNVWQRGLEGNTLVDALSIIILIIQVICFHSLRAGSNHWALQGEPEVKKVKLSVWLIKHHV
jgi:hypothetical protein